MNKKLKKLAMVCSMLPALVLAEPESVPAPTSGADMPADAGARPGSGGPGAGPHRGGMHRQGFSPRDRLMHMLDSINVTDAQKKQVEELLKTHEGKIRSSLQSEREARRQLHRLGFSADYSEAKVKELLAKMQPAQEQAALEKARLDNAIFKLLTPEQQKQLQERLSRNDGPQGPRGGRQGPRHP